MQAVFLFAKSRENAAISPKPLSVALNDRCWPIARLFPKFKFVPYLRILKIFQVLGIVCHVSKAGYSPSLIAIEKIVTHRIFANTTKILTTLVTAQDYVLNLNEDITLSQLVRGKMLKDSSFFLITHWHHYDNDRFALISWPDDYLQCDNPSFYRLSITSYSIEFKM